MAAGRVHADREVADQADPHARLARPSMRRRHRAVCHPLQEFVEQHLVAAGGGKGGDRGAVGLAQVQRPVPPVMVRRPVGMQRFEGGVLVQQVGAVGAEAGEVGAEHAGGRRAREEAVEQRPQQIELGGGRGRPVDQFFLFRSGECVAEAGILHRLGDRFPAEHQGRGGMQRIEEQPAGWRVRREARGIGREQRMHRAEAQRVGPPRRRDLGEFGNADGVTDAAVMRGAQRVDLGRHAPEPRVGHHVVDGAALRRRDRQDDLALADFQPVVADLGHRRDAQPATRRHQRQLARPAMLQHEFGRAGFGGAEIEPGRPSRGGGDQRRQVREGGTLGEHPPAGCHVAA